MFLNWVLRKPTATGWFIVRAVFATMGDDFTIHLINGITECLEKEGEEVTKENIVEVLSTMMETFATDPNILVDVVREYRTSVLHLDDDVLETDDPKDIIPGNKKTLVQHVHLREEGMKIARTLVSAWLCKDHI